MTNKVTKVELEEAKREIAAMKLRGEIHPECLRTDGYEPDAEDEARDDWAAREED